MILDDLNNYYRLKENEPGSDIPKPGWSTANVSWEFRIDESGKLVSIIPLETEERKYRQMLVPEQATRSSGIKPYFLCDKASYFLGLDDKRGEEMRKSSQERHHAILDGSPDPAAVAVLKFFDSPTDLNTIDVTLLENLAKGGLIVFRYLPDNTIVHERPDVVDLWEDSCSDESSGPIVQCAITGKKEPAAQLFPMVRGIPGSQSSGASLISFNQSSFCSYGHDEHDKAGNASISQTAAFNVGTILRYLVRSPEHHVDIGDTRVVFWTEDDTDESTDLLSLFLDPDRANSNAGEDERLLEKIQQQLKSIRKGTESTGIPKGSRYFVLGLAPSMARLSVRFFQTGTLGSLQERFSQYLKDIEIAGSDGKPLPPHSLRAYIYQTAAQGKADNVPNVLICSSMEAMLRGTAFPAALFEQLLLRTRTDKGRTGSGDRKYEALHLRVPILKAYLIRKARQYGNKEIERSLTMALNEANLNIGYLLGRLFAVLEKAQAEAIPGANSTIRDRYIGSASATPARVFPQLLKNGQHHIEKANYGKLLDRKIQDIVSLMDSAEGFPSTLSYDDQGQFFIGYYQEKQSLYAKKAADDSEKENE